MKLNLCCGLRPIADYLNVDIMNLPARYPAIFQDMDFLQYDLNQRPWPWEDGSVRSVVWRDGLEHLKSGTFIEIMDELWRVLEPNGKAAIRVPNVVSLNAFTDPTHQMFFTARSFEYLDPTTVLGTLIPHYTDYKWRVSVQVLEEETALHFVITKAEHVSM